MDERWDLPGLVGERWDRDAILREGPRPDARDVAVGERWDWATVRRERPWWRPVTTPTAGTRLGTR